MGIYGWGVEKFKKVSDAPHIKYQPKFDIHLLQKWFLAWKAFRWTNFEDLAYFEPFYLKDFTQ